MSNSQEPNSAEKAAHRELLLRRLREAANAQSVIDVANFQFVGLEDIRLAYGDRWSSHKKKILEVSRHFLTKRVGDKDILIPGASGFVIVFSRMDGASSATRAKELSNELNSFILGELDDPLGPSTNVETHEVYIDDFVDMIETPPDKAKSQNQATTTKQDDSALNWRFQPTWNVKREALSGYYVSALTQTPGLVVPGYLCDDTNYTPSFFERLDEQALALSEQALKDMFEAGRRALIGVSIHVNTLANAEARGRLLRLMNSFDKNLFPYRIVKVSSIPPGFPTLYLEEIVRFLKPYAPNISMSVSSEETDFPALIRMDVQAIGVALSPSMMVRPSPIQINLLFERIKVVTSLCRPKKILTYVEGPFSAQLAMRMCALGVDLLASSTIWQPMETPAGMLSWPADNLMKMGSAA